MSAAISAPIPLFQEANEYWQNLIRECRRQTEAMNGILAQRGVPECERIIWGSGPSVRIAKSECPSTVLQFDMQFFPWGPMITGTATGDQSCDLKLALEEFDFPIAMDLDGAIVAIIEEGRSLSPREVALLLTQKFRRCFPGISLPIA